MAGAGGERCGGRWLAAACLAGLVMAAPKAWGWATFDRVVVRSDRVVSLLAEGPVGEGLGAPADPSAYRLARVDPGGAPRPPVHPERVGVERRPTALGGTWTDIRPIAEVEVVLVFADSLRSGWLYTLAVGDDPPFTFAYREEASINGSVKVNQVGYLPDGPKVGYVGNYLGDAGAMAIAPRRFEVREASTGEARFGGEPQFAGEDLRLSGERVYRCDFSAFDVAGSYYLFVPGVGRSHTFRIGVDVYATVAYHTLRALYYQRCGAALEAPATDPRWAHANCHLEDAVIHPANRAAPLYAGEPIGAVHRATGGWHDAGDYGKYVPTAATALFYLFTAYELYPERFPDGVGHLPESGNGVSDLLDEARWEVDWLKDMQADDGGVHFKVATRAWPTTMPEHDLATRDLAPKTTFSTAQYAAALAMAARAFAGPWPGYAGECRRRAERAWGFLQRHPRPEPKAGFTNPDGIGGGPYTDPDGDVDDRAWAAAELYKTTGRAEYHEAFGRLWAEHPPMWGWNAWQHHQQQASWAYATTGYSTQPARVGAYRDELRRVVRDELIGRTDRNQYHNAYRSDVAVWIGWGAFAQSTRYAWEILTASHLLDEPAWRRPALLNLDTQLGANPLSMSFITGVGAAYPMDPLHHPSLHDGVDEPVPGLPVFGPHHRLSEDNPWFIAAKEVFYPAARQDEDPYPLLRRYADSNKLVPMSEFTIVEIAQAAVVFGAFADVTGAAPAPAPPDTGQTGADFDGSGEQDVSDLHRLAWALGGRDRTFDLDGDGAVGPADATRFARRWRPLPVGAGPAPDPAPAAVLRASAGGGDGEVVVTVAVTGAPVWGYQLEVRFDADALELADVVAAGDSFFGDAAPLALEPAPDGDGLAAVADVRRTGHADLLHLRFRLRREPPAGWVEVSGLRLTDASARARQAAGTRLQGLRPVPTTSGMEASYPNPFNGTTAIRIRLSRSGPVQLAVYDALGQRVRTLVDGRRDAGTYRVLWDGRDDAGRPAASGIYLCRLSGADARQVRRLVLVR